MNCTEIQQRTQELRMKFLACQSLNAEDLQELTDLLTLLDQCKSNINQVQSNIDRTFSFNTLLPNSIGTIFTAPSGSISRELGNIIKSTDNFYYKVTSVSQEPYTGTNVNVHLLRSSDLVTWTDQGAIINQAEDPYIIFDNNQYYVFVEDKSVIPFRNIKLYTSTNLTSWTDRGVVLDREQTGWDSQDVSSPVVTKLGNTWHMLFEGRSSTQTGALGSATSADLINWTKNVSNPILSGTDIDSDFNWGRNIVPDDIIKINDLYYLTTHVSTPVNNAFVNGVFVSRDLINWSDYLGTWLTKGIYGDAGGSGLMLYDSEEYGIIASFINESEDRRSIIFSSLGVINDPDFKNKTIRGNFEGNFPDIDASTLQGIQSSQFAVYEPVRTNIIENSNIGRYATPPASESNVMAPDGTNTAVVPVPGSSSHRYEYLIDGGTYNTDTKLVYSWYRRRISTPVNSGFLGDLDIRQLINLTIIEEVKQIESDLNGFDRFQVSVNVIDGSVQSRFRAYFGNVIDVGNSSVAYWGHQLETGETAGTLIRTSGSAKTSTQGINAEWRNITSNSFVKLNSTINDVLLGDGTTISIYSLKALNTINSSVVQTSSTLNVSHPLNTNPIGTIVVNLDSTQRYIYTRISNTAWRRSELMTNI